MYPYIPDTPTHTQLDTCIPNTSPLIFSLLADRNSPFFKGRHEWAGHVFDWAEAVTERARQERRRQESPGVWSIMHNEECICGICAWIEKDMWEAEERAERASSRNVFFNGLYETQKEQLCIDLLKCEEFWKYVNLNWNPSVCRMKN